MTTIQGALTVITEIKPGETGRLRSLLCRINEDVESNDLVPFLKLTTIHFARWVILPEVRGNEGKITFPAMLVFSTNFDAPLDNHLRELVNVACIGIDQVYSRCEGYHSQPERMRANLLDYLQAHMVDYDIFYVGNPGISVSQVHEEAGLRAAIEEFLDREAAKNSDWSGHSAGDVRAAIQQFVGAEPDLAWAQAPPGPKVKSFAWYQWVGISVGVILMSPALLLWLLLVRIQEIREDKGRARQVATTCGSRGGPFAPMLAVREAREGIDRNIREVTTIEDEIVQNQLSHVVDIKPGWLRLATLKIVLKIVNFGGLRIYNQGDLFGVQTLHFVRWMIIDEGKRLLFLTNYDGSMISYVGDFVNKSWQIPWALTAIWSNTVGFPDTRWLILDGAKNFNRFAAFLRNHQVPTQVWYSAYKRSTNGNIMNNARIRRGLFSDLVGLDTLEWLRRF